MLSFNPNLIKVKEKMMVVVDRINMLIITGGENIKTIGKIKHVA